MLKKHEEILDTIIFDFLRLGISHEHIFYSTYDKLDKIVILSDIYQGEIKRKISNIGSNIFDYYQSQIENGIDEYEINRISIIPLKMESITKKKYKPIKDYFSSVISKYIFGVITEKLISKCYLEIFVQEEVKNTILLDYYKKFNLEAKLNLEKNYFDKINTLSSFLKSKNATDRFEISISSEFEENIMPTTKMYLQQIKFNNAEQNKINQPYDKLKSSTHINELTMLAA